MGPFQSYFLSLMLDIGWGEGTTAIYYGCIVSEERTCSVNDDEWITAWEKPFEDSCVAFWALTCVRHGLRTVDQVAHAAGRRLSARVNVFLQRLSLPMSSQCGHQSLAVSGSFLHTSFQMDGAVLVLLSVRSCYGNSHEASRKYYFPETQEATLKAVFH